MNESYILDPRADGRVFLPVNDGRPAYVVPVADEPPIDLLTAPRMTMNVKKIVCERVAYRSPVLRWEGALYIAAGDQERALRYLSEAEAVILFFVGLRSMAWRSVR